MKLGREEVCALIPHAGSMCLLDAVEYWDEHSIVCSSMSHLRGDNPLRGAMGLAAVHGMEYGAQAMALHGALLSAGEPLTGGLLAALRDVRLHVGRLDEIAGALQIFATRLMADGGNLLYRVEARGAGRLLVEGRVTVVDMRGRTV